MDKTSNWKSFEREQTNNYH